MRRTIVLVLTLAVTTVFAQKIKIKKGVIFIDSKKAGTIEKIKVKGEKKYQKIFDSKGNALFEVKLIREKSRYFGKKKRHSYYIIKCLTKNDTIGVEDLSFYLVKKFVVKYLVKNKLFGLNGINDENVDSLLAKTTTKPSYILKEIAKDNYFIKNKEFIVDRDITQKLFVEKMKPRSFHTILTNQLITPKLYRLYQGVDFNNKIFIGYAIIENVYNTSNLFILNSKKVPIAMFDNYRYYSFYPTKEFKITKLPSDIIKLDKPVAAIRQFSSYLIKEGKL